MKTTFLALMLLILPLAALAASATPPSPDLPTHKANFPKLINNAGGSASTERRGGPSERGFLSEQAASTTLATKLRKDLVFYSNQIDGKSATSALAMLKQTVASKRVEIARIATSKDADRAVASQLLGWLDGPVSKWIANADNLLAAANQKP